MLLQFGAEYGILAGVRNCFLTKCKMRKAEGRDPVLKSKAESEITKCCAMCEYSLHMTADDSFVCKYKNRLRKTEAEDVCRRFSLDLLKIEPPPRRIFRADE